MLNYQRVGGWEGCEGWGFGVALKVGAFLFQLLVQDAGGVVVSASMFSMVWGRSCWLQVWGMG
jgi:hypothetical protein